jgi:predicted small metal-binding protein
MSKHATGPATLTLREPHPCGFVARGDSDDQVAGMIRGHITIDHPTLLETVSQDDLVSWIQAE